MRKIFLSLFLKEIAGSSSEGRTFGDYVASIWIVSRVPERNISKESANKGVKLICKLIKSALSLDDVISRRPGEFRIFGRSLTRGIFKLTARH